MLERKKKNHHAYCSIMRINNYIQNTVDVDGCARGSHKYNVSYEIMHKTKKYYIVNF